MIYFDNSATTKIAPEALAAYDQVSQKIWGNPSSLHKLGETAFNLLQQARSQVATLMGKRPEEIFFTSGGSEGDNWAIKGTALAKAEFGKHIITTSIEHPAVLNSMAQLEKLGFEVTYLPVDATGRIKPENVAAAVRSDTILVSIMAVNNEIGAVQPIDQVAQVLAKYPKIHFHVDAVQAIGKGLGKMLANPRIDLMSFSGHKFHAPRGVGFMYKRTGRMIAPLINGGGQEQNLRGGTENLPAIVAQAKALRLLLANEAENVKQMKALKHELLDFVSGFDKVTVFGQQDDAWFAPHILCFAIDGVRGETIVHAFEAHDIYMSTTSACSSKKHVASGTLTAMHVPADLATSAVRISLDEANSAAEVAQFKQAFKAIYTRFLKINS